MDIVLKQNVVFDLESKIKATADLFRLSKLEKKLSEVFESLPDNSPIDYVGELNKNDIMH